jgi:hypothetical protein
MQKIFVTTEYLSTNQRVRIVQEKNNNLSYFYGSVQVRTHSEPIKGFGNCPNPEPNHRFSSGQDPNLNANLGFSSVQFGSDHGSEPNFPITRRHCMGETSSLSDKLCLCPIYPSHGPHTLPGRCMRGPRGFGSPASSRALSAVDGGQSNRYTNMFFSLTKNVLTAKCPDGVRLHLA